MCDARSGVAGYPRVQHGGFSAAFMDEVMGLLFYALHRHRKLPFLGPAFTAHLDVDYKHVRVSCACSGTLLGHDIIDLAVSHKGDSRHA